MEAEDDLQRIYVLCHTYTVNEGDPDAEETDLKRLYYSVSEKACYLEISFYKDLPGFRDFPNGFKVMHTDLNSHYWEEGFTRW